MTLFLRLNDFDFLAAGPIAELDLAADHRLARKVAVLNDDGRYKASRLENGANRIMVSGEVDPTDQFSVFTVASLNCYVTR